MLGTGGTNGKNKTLFRLNMVKITGFETKEYPKTLVVGIDSPINPTKNIDSYFEEFLNLVRTNGVPYEHAHFIKLRSIDNAYFITEGKLAEIKDLCEKYHIKQVILSESIAPKQERNMSDFLGCTIIDRTLLILEIFEKSAHSGEGKTQVEIAMLQYLKSRLAGKGITLSQQSGSIGVRGGFGETLKERERRQIDNLIKRLTRELAQLERTRETQRKQRVGANIPQICLIGYTNAGKSTILNSLTKSNVLAEDKLFATLDTTTRELFVNGVKKGLLSDTVGFIQNLPHRLIEAFKSTLAELQYADLLVQVVDISDSNWEEHIGVVQQILGELNVQKEMVFVFNKSDKIEITKPLLLKMAKYQPHVLTNGLSRDGLKELSEFLANWNPHKETTQTK